MPVQCLPLLRRKYVTNIYVLMIGSKLIPNVLKMHAYLRLEIRAVNRHLHQDKTRVKSKKEMRKKMKR